MDRVTSLFAALVLMAISIIVPVASWGQVSGAYVTSARGAVAGDVSGIEVQAHANGNGVYVTMVQVSYTTEADLEDVVMSITSASVFDTGLTAVTPGFKFGPDALDTVVRTGVDSVGTIVADAAGHFAPFSGPGTEVPSYRSGTIVFNPPVFIPPGSFFTIRNQTVNEAIAATIGFYEKP